MTLKKQILLYLSCIFLFQSCYSYREIDKNNNSKKIGNTYSVRINKSNYKGKLLVFNDSIVTLKKGVTEKEFKISEISKFKQRKFSVVKTILLPIGISAAIVGLFLATYDGPQIGEINITQ